MGMMQQTLLAKANYFIVGLFAFLAICLSSNSYADNKQDIAELEAFYHMVFDEKQTFDNTPAAPKTTKKTIPKTKRIQQAKKQKPATIQKSQIDIADKDPELVAFYESIFGKIENEPTIKPKRELAVTKKQIKPKKNPAAKKLNNVRYKNKEQSKKQKKVVSTNNDESMVSNEVTESKQNTNTVNADKLEEAQSVTTKLVSSPEVIEQNQSEAGTGILDSNLLSSQVQKTTATDTKSLFEKAFGKTKKKQKSSAPAKPLPKLNKPATKLAVNDMASLFAKAFGNKAVVAAPSNVKVDFRLSSSIIGEVELFSNNSGPINLVGTDALLKILKDVLKEHVFSRVAKELKNANKTSFSDLNRLGISVFYNSSNLSLDTEIKPELRKPQILSLLNKKKATVREENKVEAEKFSGFLNAFTNVGLNSRGDEADFRMRLEGSLNIGGAVLETTTDYRNDKFDLGRTTLTFDKPEKLQRLSIGNISTGNRNFQESLELDGFRLSKEFFLDPDLQITPRANESLQLDTDSEVELYINNQLVRRFYLKAGVYSLQDIGLYNGANNIRIRIKDEFGKVTVKSSQQFYDSHLLKPGLSLFAISVGYLSNQQSYSNRELEKTPIFSGYFQKGIKEDLTVSLDAQLSAKNFLIGAEAISSISLGSIRNSIAVSGGKERETGYAASFEFRPNKKQEQISLDTLRQDLLGLDTRSRGLLNNWSITGEYRSEDFSLLNGVNPDLTGSTDEVSDVNFGNRVFNSNKLKANLQTNFSLNISEKWQGTLNLGVADYYDADESYYANLSATRRFDNGARLSIGTRYDTEDEFSMNLQLSIPLSRKKGKKRIDLDVLSDSRDSAYETKLSLKPSGLVGKNSLAGSIEHYEDKDSQQQNVDIQYRDNLFESKFTARNRTNKGSNNSSQQYNLGFNTAIACVGSSCAPSYPINDSFALVSGPSNQTQPIALSNNGLRFRYSDGNDTGLPDNYSALIPGKDKKAVVRLESYRTQNINIDEGTLPIGYDSEKTEFSVFPKYHQGFLIKAGGEPATTLDGMLFDDQNQPLSFKGGQWVPDNKGKAVAFFSNKGGRFRVTSIPAGKYKLELFDYPDMQPIQINVPDTKGKIHDLGNLTIKTPN